jgi:hypothetical protein
LNHFIWFYPTSSNLVLFDLIWTYLFLFNLTWTNFIWFEPNNQPDPSWSFLIQFEPIWTNLNQFYLIWTKLFKQIDKWVTRAQKHDKWLKAWASSQFPPILHIKRIWILRNEVKWASSISWVLLACTSSSVLDGCRSSNVLYRRGLADWKVGLVPY